MPANSSYPYRSAIGGGGSPYPTGRAPMVLGLEDTISAITQEMVKNRKEEVKTMNLEIDANEKMLLDALDMEPLQGMQEKAALEFTNGLDQLTDKYSKLLKDRGGVFTREDKLNLAKDKRELERKLSVAASDIATWGEYKKQVALGPEKSYLDLGQLIPDMNEYEKKGLIGTGGAASIGKLKPVPFGEDWMAEVLTPASIKDLQTKANMDVSSSVVNPSTGAVEYQYDNSKLVGNYMQMATQLPSFQRMYAEDPEKAMQMAGAVAQRLTINPTQQGYSASVKPRATGTGRGTGTGIGPQATTQAQNNYGWNLPADQTETIETFHSTAEGVRRGDPTALDRIIGTGEGQLKETEYFVKDGKAYVHLKANPTKYNGKIISGKEEILRIPPRGDKEGAKTFYGKIYNYYPSEFKKGVEKLNISNYITPEPFEQGEVGDMAPNRDVMFIDETINSISGNKKRKGNAEELSLLAQRLNVLAPENKVKADNQTSKISIDGTQFDLHDPAQLNAFRAKVDEITTHYYEVDGDVKEVPLATELKFLYKYPNAKPVKWAK